ncbi:HAD family hydrolase [Candidatus Solincola tengchongensis]|uniref:HAD family hydrolase n=1 Tax=Candidatus Solincola tengchongensis TaxID=2900693 RepID=UPI00257A8ABB|nr:HAD family hydrolase [Candidatus Solincola tengchongensis]
MENKPIAFFDLDHTLLDGANGNLVVAYMVRKGLLGWEAVWKALKFTVLYRLNRLPREEVYRWTFRECGKYPIAELIRMLDEAYEACIMPRLFREGEECIAEHRARGHLTVIATAAGEYICEKVRVQLGADDKIAAVAPVRNGYLTDELERPLPYREGKEQLARSYAAARGVDLRDCWFYSDSLADLPLLEAVGHPVAVNPQGRLRRLAEERGWPVLRWSTPAGYTQPSRAVRLTFDPFEEPSTAEESG